jgi:L,D-transpeptidase YcbB
MNLGSGWMKWHKVNPKIRSLIFTLTVVLKFCLLTITIFLFGGNENANPTVGNSTVEFYSSEFRQQIYYDVTVNKNNYNNYSTESLVNKFYDQRKYMPAWTLNFKANQAYKDLIRLLETSKSYGLFESLYPIDKLKKIEGEMMNHSSEDIKLKARLQFERLATASAFDFMMNLSIGLNYDKANASFISLYDKLPGYLNYIIRTGNVRDRILKIQPQSEQYIMLQAALVKFIQNVNLNSFVYLAEDFQRTKGLAEKILVEQGYLDQSFINDSIAVEVALKNYQILNSLEPTGLADEKTYERLGRSTKDIFKQIALNLDRLRKDALASENYILVNIPEFNLSYVDADGLKNNFNVVVGKNNSPTPILESKIEHIIANPNWTVPNSIALNEILPKIQTDSTYLSKHGYKIVDKDAKAIDDSNLDWNKMNKKNFKYYFRQDMGEKNALGKMKFLFPNEYSVYLHDTPSKEYFKKQVRAFSHGCVRVENPDKLAQLIISAHCLNSDAISMESLIKSKQQQVIKIDKPVSIFIKYYTCTADSNGNISFYPDIYSYDGEAIQQLFANNYQE